MSKRIIVPISYLWFWVPVPNIEIFDIIFPKETILTSSVLLALFDVETPPNKCISVGGQNIDDQYWTKEEPLLPCYVPYQQIVIPANTKATCAPVLPSLKAKYDGKLVYKGKHLAYGAGLLDYKK